MIRSMAGVAMPGEDRLNLADKIHLGWRGRRKVGGINLRGKHACRRHGKAEKRQSRPIDPATLCS